MPRPRRLVTVACLSWLVCGAALAASLARAQASPERWPSAVAIPGARVAPGEALLTWMRERLSSYGLAPGPDSLRIERVEPLPSGGSRVLVRQLWHGLPVVGADARAVLDADGRLRSLISGFVTSLSAPLEPRLSAAAAISLAPGAAGASLLDASAAATLVIARRADGDHLAWDVASTRPDGEPVRTLIDAVSGVRLEDNSDGVIAHAVGRVYPTDPRGALEERELPRLLAGPGMSAQDFGLEDGLFPPAVPVGPGDYRFAPEDPSFDQVNLYWHVDHDLHDFFAPLGYAGPPVPLVVRLHFALEPEVARTAGNFVTLGRPIAAFTRETSRADDIVYHELAHAVLYGFGVQPGGPRREASALHEALADYFAAAFTGDPVIGEWLYIVFPNGTTRLDRPAPPWDYAHYDQVAFGGGGLSSAWGNSMILSSGLWELRQRIGATCDSLVLESLTYLPTVPTWAQFANAMFVADLDHHDARDWPEIARMFFRRGIHGSVTASISGPAVLAPAQQGVFGASPCCGGAPGQYHWRLRTWCRGVPCSAWQDLADGDTLRTSFFADAELQLTSTSAFGDTATALKRVLVESPTLTLDGPLRVLRNATASWTARCVAAAPVRLTWFRRWLRPVAVTDTLGHAQTVSFNVESPCELSVTLVDVMGRILTRLVNVETFTDKPPRDSPAAVRVTMTMDAAFHVETHVELGKATSLRLAVYDIRGRERMRLADGPAARGERVLHWDASPLEPGIYFLRASTADDHADAHRFIVLH